MLKRFMIGVMVCMTPFIAAMAADAPAPAAAPAAPPATPRQVNVAVKIIEFQTNKAVETGLAAYFRNASAIAGEAGISNADLTFPNTADAGITVFLDRIVTGEGNIEIVLQALEDQNRAFILSRPRMLVPEGQSATIKTTDMIPFESSTVVGTMVSQIVEFRETGVSLTVTVEEIRDYDNDPDTTDDIFIRLKITADIREEGERITVTLDDMLARDGLLGASNAIKVPSFINRNLDTTVWVPHNEVLVLGGLFRNNKQRSLSTIPWLPQAENMLNGALQSPLGLGSIPLTAGLGNNAYSDSHRELVFLIKTNLWRPAFTLGDMDEFVLEEDDSKGILEDVLETITVIPEGISQGLSGDKIDPGVSSSLGGDGK